MTKGIDKKTYLVLAVGLGVLLAIATKLESSTSAGLVSGYVLFSANFAILAKIYASLVDIMRGGVASPKLKAGIMLGSALKFVGLIAALYVLIILWKLPGLFIAIGSLISLFLLTVLLLVSYLKSFRTPSAS